MRSSQQVVMGPVGWRRLSMNKLAVTVDISPVIYNRGVSRYTSNLVQALAQQREIDLSVFGSNWGQHKQLIKWSQTLPADVKKHLYALPPAVLRTSWQVTGWPKPLSARGVFHAWDWQMPVWPKVGQVVTIHDLAHLIFPETAHPQVKKRYDRLIKQIEENENVRVIAVSHATRVDILRLTKIPAERVHVVYEALPSEAQLVPTADEQQATLRQFDLIDRPYLLFVGTTEPRKNLANIIQAWQQVKDRFDLVIAGAAGWDNYQLEDGMHNLGYVEPAQLASLYRQAQALVYVSWYEGFGLPILEAYFHRCPVITANVSAMAEIAGSPALLVDPSDPNDIAEAMESIEDPQSRARRKRERDMQEVLSNFSWTKTAEETIQVYQQARLD